MHWLPESGDPAYLTLQNNATGSSKWDCSLSTTDYFSSAPLLYDCQAERTCWSHWHCCIVLLHASRDTAQRKPKLSRGRNGVKQNHHPETAQTKQSTWRNGRSRIPLWSAASCNTFPSPTLLVYSTTSSAHANTGCLRQVTELQRGVRALQKLIFLSAAFFCLPPTYKYCWEITGLLGAVQACSWHAQICRWPCTGPQCFAPYSNLYVSLTWKTSYAFFT